MGRQDDSEGRPRTGGSRALDCSPLCAHDRLGNGQAQASASSLSRSGAVEAIENVRQVVAGDAYALVDEVNPDAAIDALHLHPHCRMGR